MSHCRIGKIKFKSGGEIVALPTNNPTIFDELFKDGMREARNEDAIAAGFFVCTKDGFVVSHFRVGDECPNSRLLGGATQLQNDIAFHIKK